MRSVTLAYVEERQERGVGGQEGLGQREPAVGRVVERALQPLRRQRVRGVAVQGDEVARQGAAALRAHGVALVRHGARADLRRLERFLDLLARGQDADVGAHLVNCGSEPGQRGDHFQVHLPRENPLEFVGEGGQPADDGGQARQQQLQSVAQHDEVGVVTHVARGGAQVQYGCSPRAALGQRVHVRHHVVPHGPLVLRRRREVDVVHRTLQLRDLLLRYVQAELLEHTSCEWDSTLLTNKKVVRKVHRAAMVSVQTIATIVVKVFKIVGLAVGSLCVIQGAVYLLDTALSVIHYMKEM
ncbi:unnamed protein product [Leptidea sinapis]|uniref:Uncharacterized protein n=1 Tax=Leptidea sinapis TaxID=189913 RepID=A0A5E4R2T3_9NEOP|nr:unnamed protein product [Leptidea sinapis]